MLLEILVNTWSLKISADEPLLGANVAQQLGILNLRAKPLGFILVPTTYWLYNLRKVTNLSLPQFSHLQNREAVEGIK